MSQVDSLFSLILSKIINFKSRDIKPGNILIDSASNVIRICDFGCSLHNHDPRSGSIQKFQPRNLGFLSPELFLEPTSLKFGCANDIWSAGVVIAVLLKGTAVFPCEDEDELFQKIQEVFTNSLIYHDFFIHSYYLDSR